METLNQFGNKNIEILQTNAIESDQVNFIKLINKYDLFARTLRSFMFKKPPRVKSGSRSDIWQLVSMGLKVRLLGKKNMRELLRVIGLNIADDLEDNLKPLGAAVIVEAAHGCMQCRGVAKQNAVMTTSAMRGVFFEKNEARSELMQLIQSPPL